VQDLVALGQFLLLPEDDLTLATVLKGRCSAFPRTSCSCSPIDRGKERLWTRLRRLAAEDPRMHAAASACGPARPRRFHAAVRALCRNSRRRRAPQAMLERLGPEAADPIDEFLALALAYEREHVPSLQGFCAG
jgi:ATP-dependent helicase/nuclease subunit A